MRSYNCSFIKVVVLLLGFTFSLSLFGESGEISKPVGSLSILLPPGTTSSPSYTIAAAGLKSTVVFRGQVKQVSGNDIVFDRVPDLLDPTLLSWPFKNSMLATIKARAHAVLDSNQSIASVILDYPGDGYLVKPEIRISLPSEGNMSALNYEPAYATSTVSSGSVTSIILDANYSGKGYQSIPKVEIEGGVHFLRCVESGSPNEGKFYRILSNTGDTLSLSNSLGDDLSTVFKLNAMVEVFEAWTLGSLFGYSSTQLQEGNSSVADYIYLIKSPDQQNGTVSDYRSYFYDGNSWKDTNGSSADMSETIIYPDESFILARRTASPLELFLFGGAHTQNSFVKIPATGERFLMNNPFGVDVMLSDLIASINITDDNSTASSKWLASVNQANADNVHILKNGVWNSYWHDGSNMGITEVASVTARRGTGAAAAITLQDLSMSTGVISGMTNPSSGNIVVTSANHSLREGFMVKLSNAYGYKTNDAKQQVDEDGNVVSTGSGLVISSAANGFFEVVNPTVNTFELLGKIGNCDFIAPANWKTGSNGLGYTTNAYVSFVGGGGKGAYGIAHVANSSVQSISLIDSGYGYTSAPKVFIHSGGWRRFGAGNAPFNDVLVPAGSGILLTRNHPVGVASMLRINTPLQ